MYLLLGDPELKVWRAAPYGLTLAALPASVPQGAGVIEVEVRRANGLVQEPVEFAIVSATKAGEFAANRYTDATGIARVPIDPASPGTIFVTAYTEFGAEGVAAGSIEVTAASAVAGAGPAPRALAIAVRPWAAGSGFDLDVLLPGPAAGLAVRLYDVAGRLRAREFRGPLAGGEHRLRMDGSRMEVRSSGVYWIEAEARFAAGGRMRAARAHARWLKMP